MKRFRNELVYKMYEAHNKTIFDFDFTIKTSFQPKEYRNHYGNCLIVALCDIFNSMNNNNKYYPMPKSNREMERNYNNLCDFLWDRYKYNFKDNQIYPREIKTNEYGLIIMTNSKGCHAVASTPNGLLNNWWNRSYQTTNELLNEIKIKRQTKTFAQLKDINILNKTLNEAIKLKLIREKA